MAVATLTTSAELLKEAREHIDYQLYYISDTPNKQWARDIRSAAGRAETEVRRRELLGYALKFMTAHPRIGMHKSPAQIAQAKELRDKIAAFLGQ